MKRKGENNNKTNKTTMKVFSEDEILAMALKEKSKR
jgi:hypothetical protein